MDLMWIYVDYGISYDSMDYPGVKFYIYGFLK